MAETIQNITVNIPYTASPSSLTNINVAYAVVDKNKNIVNYKTLSDNLTSTECDNFTIDLFYVYDCNLYNWKNTGYANIGVAYQSDDENVNNFETSPIKYKLCLNVAQNNYNSSIYYIIKAKCGSIESQNYLRIILARNPSGINAPSGSKIEI